MFSFKEPQVVPLAVMCARQNGMYGAWVKGANLQAGGVSMLFQ